MASSSLLNPFKIPTPPDLEYPDPSLLVNVDGDPDSWRAEYREVTQPYIDQLESLAEKGGFAAMQALQAQIGEELKSLEDEIEMSAWKYERECRVVDALTEIAAAMGSDYDASKLAGNPNHFYNGSQWRWQNGPVEHLRVYEEYTSGTIAECLSKQEDLSQQIFKRLSDLKLEKELSRFRLSITRRIGHDILYGHKSATDHQRLKVQPHISSPSGGIQWGPTEKRRALMALALLDHLEALDADLDRISISQLEDLVRKHFPKKAAASKPLYKVLYRALKGIPTGTPSELQLALKTHLALAPHEKRTLILYRQKLQLDSFDTF